MMRVREVDHQALAVMHPGDVDRDAVYLRHAVEAAQSVGYVAVKGLWIPSDQGRLGSLDEWDVPTYALSGDAARPLAVAALQRFRQPATSLTTREQEVQKRMEHDCDLRPLFRDSGAIALVEGKLPAVKCAVDSFTRTVIADDALRAGHIQV